VAGVGKPSPLADATPLGANDYPPPGEWPCQTEAPDEITLPPRLVGFLYRLLRDGAKTPGEVESIALAVRQYEDGDVVSYANAHLQSYARSLARFLAPLAEVIEPSDQQTEVLPSQGGAKVLPPPPMPPGGTP
jgi:hypothetical protein